MIAGLRGLDAYQNSLAFYRAVVSAVRGRAKSHVIDQLLRASESVALNVAEVAPGKAWEEGSMD